MGWLSKVPLHIPNTEGASRACGIMTVSAIGVSPENTYCVISLGEVAGELQTKEDSLVHAERAHAGHHYTGYAVEQLERGASVAVTNGYADNSPVEGPQAGRGLS